MNRIADTRTATVTAIHLSYICPAGIAADFVMLPHVSCLTLSLVFPKVKKSLSSCRL